MGRHRGLGTNASKVREPHHDCLFRHVYCGLCACHKFQPRSDDNKSGDFNISTHDIRGRHFVDSGSQGVHHQVAWIPVPDSQLKGCPISSKEQTHPHPYPNQANPKSRFSADRAWMSPSPPPPAGDPAPGDLGAGLRDLGQACGALSPETETEDGSVWWRWRWRWRRSCGV